MYQEGETYSPVPNFSRPILVFCLPKGGMPFFIFMKKIVGMFDHVPLGDDERVEYDELKQEFEQLCFDHEIVCSFVRRVLRLVLRSPDTPIHTKERVRNLHFFRKM